MEKCLWKKRWHWGTKCDLRLNGVTTPTLIASTNPPVTKPKTVPKKYNKKMTGSINE